MSDGDSMPEDLMRYDVLAQHALRSVVKLALQRVVRDGLPGEHHFFISFDTNYPGASVSSRIKAKYPDDMTIVLQHQFTDLNVFDKYFEVQLSFDNVSERLVVPFASIKGFFDPTVQFGLQFEPGALDDGEGSETTDIDSTDNAQDTDIPLLQPSSANDQSGAAKASNDDTTVVSLDAFRKK